MARKKNCWEIMICGRQPGGEKVKELGICPAATDTAHNGLNEGVNAGRYCWTNAGTFCNGDIQGTFAQKKATCLECEFFKKVKAEENLNFIFNNLQLQLRKSFEIT